MPIAVACTGSLVSDPDSDSIPDSSSDEEPQPEWRREVSQRLATYRARRRRLIPDDDSQSGLPFQNSAAATRADLARNTRRGSDYSVQANLADMMRTKAFEVPGNQTISGVEVPENDPSEGLSRERVRSPQRRRQASSDRMDIRIQPELDFSAPDDRAHPQTALVPVAALADRRIAGALDATFLALTGAAFLGLFHSLGGEVTIERVDAAVGLSVLFLFYALYFSLFTTFAGSTPGMQIRGLTVVRLDGSLPDTRQLLWRSFGYLLSGGTFLLGFVWALWDEDRFTWQDRISHTYMTEAAPIADAACFEVLPGRRNLARK